MSKHHKSHDSRETVQTSRRYLSRPLAVGLSLLTGACGTSEASASFTGVAPDPGVAPTIPTTTVPIGSISSQPDSGMMSPQSDAGIQINSGVVTPVMIEQCSIPDAAAGLDPSFDEYAVTHDEVGRTVIYSWTTQTQIDELRVDPTLLTRSMTLTGERGRASDYILSMAPYDEIAAILAGPEFENKRFGWANPWATVLGWSGETYGDQLLEIRLRPEAWIGRILTSTGEWAFFDTNNVPVNLDDVKAHPERIAAVYFVDDQNAFDCGGTFGSGPAYREYFIANESMIESWSAYTVEIRDELLRAIDTLEGFRGTLAEGGCQTATGSIDCWREAVVALWQREPATLLEQYESSLPFPNELYVATTSNIDRLVEQLQAVLFEPNPLTHTYP